MKHLSPDLLAAFADGQAPTAAEAAHLGACALCRGEVATLRALASDLDFLPAPPPGLRQATLQRLGLAPRSRPRLRAWAWGPALVAGLALVWVLPLFRGPQAPGPVSPPSPGPAKIESASLGHASVSVTTHAAAVWTAAAPMAARPASTPLAAAEPASGAVLAPAQVEGAAALGAPLPATPTVRTETKVADADNAKPTPGPAPQSLAIKSVRNNLLRPARGDRLSFTVALGQAGELSVLVLDSRGRTVATLFDGPSEAGDVGLSWDGSVPSGAYTILAHASGSSTSLNVIVVR